MGNVKTQQDTMMIFIVLIVFTIITADAFAFENGARATISQVWLGVNGRHWGLTYLAVFFFAALVQHVAVPHEMPPAPAPPFLRQALLWTPAFWLGLWVSYRHLWQLPNVD